jgi:hypothetical protein
MLLRELRGFPKAALAADQSRNQDLISGCYGAFNARDLDAALQGLHPEVDWPNAIDGGRVRGHDELRRYWTRQFAAIDPYVEPEGFAEDEQGRVVVDVHQVVRDLHGEVLADQRIQHVYSVRDGLIERMDIREAKEGGVARS